MEHELDSHKDSEAPTGLLWGFLCLKQVSIVDVPGSAFWGKWSSYLWDFLNLVMWNNIKWKVICTFSFSLGQLAEWSVQAQSILMARHNQKQDHDGESEPVLPSETETFLS